MSNYSETGTYKVSMAKYLRRTPSTFTVSKVSRMFIYLNDHSARSAPIVFMVWDIILSMKIFKRNRNIIP